MSSQPSIELKGSTFTLPVLYLNQSEPQQLIEQLQQKIAQAPNLLTHASIIVNLSQLDAQTDVVALTQVIESSGLHVVGYSGCDKQQRRRLQDLGLLVLNEGKAALTEPAALAPLYLTTPLRSGQQVYAKNRDIVVTSLVSTGAEIIADGNIYIFSTLRGKAIAGADGNHQAQIFCTQLEAELISIAGNYWLSDQIPLEFYKKSAQIKLLDNQLQIETLKTS